MMSRAVIPFGVGRLIFGISCGFGTFGSLHGNARVLFWRVPACVSAPRERGEIGVEPSEGSVDIGDFEADLVEVGALLAFVVVEEAEAVGFGDGKVQLRCLFDDPYEWVAHGVVLRMHARNPGA